MSRRSAQTFTKNGYTIIVGFAPALGGWVWQIKQDDRRITNSVAADRRHFLTCWRTKRDAVRYIQTSLKNAKIPVSR